MPKKYILARTPIIFDSLDELIAYAADYKAQDIDGLVVGSFVGELKLDTSMVLKNVNKIKKLKSKPRLDKKIPDLPVEDDNEETPAISTIQCSFCHREKVKTVLIDRIPTHLCEEHCSIEKELLNVGN